jgi:hypothetical protein
MGFFPLFSFPKAQFTTLSSSSAYALKVAKVIDTSIIIDIQDLMPIVVVVIYLVYTHIAVVYTSI